METTTIATINLQVGNIVHQHGARFVVRDVTNKPEFKNGYGFIGPSDVVSANCEWIDGVVVTGYFGPGVGWAVQGNRHAQVTIEK